MTMSQNCRVHGPKVLGPRTLGPQGAFFRLDPKGGHSRVKKHFAISVVMAGSSFDMNIEFTWTSLRCDRSSEVLPSKNHNPGGRPYRGACGALLPGRGGGSPAVSSTCTAYFYVHIVLKISCDRMYLLEKKKPREVTDFGSSRNGKVSTASPPISFLVSRPGKKCPPPPLILSPNKLEIGRPPREGAPMWVTG